ncbi:MAG: hypothetical protein JXA22_09280 [Candidatus Thermoplasmatota archaeon]|nr:hypothetical protein [Candidatus Thermoplasmatota archaeon]
MAHVIVLIILICILGLTHLLAVSLSINLFLAIMNEGILGEIGLFASAMGIYAILPKAFLFMVIAFGVAMYKRGVYGEAHEKATLAALLTAILGTITPLFLFVISMAFDKGYLTGPMLGHMVLIAVFVALFLYIKDFGARTRAMAGLIVYIIGSLMLAAIETVALYFIEDMSHGAAQVLSAMAIPWTIVLVAGAILFLTAYIKGLSWVKAHKPRIDEQQAEQIHMQKEQMVMQKEQLEMQKQQIEMLQQTISMLTEMRSDLIGSGGELITETAGKQQMPSPERPE